MDGLIGRPDLYDGLLGCGEAGGLAWPSVSTSASICTRTNTIGRLACASLVPQRLHITAQTSWRTGDAASVYAATAGTIPSPCYTARSAADGGHWAGCTPQGQVLPSRVGVRRDLQGYNARRGDSQGGTVIGSGLAPQRGGAERGYRAGGLPSPAIRRRIVGYQADILWFILW
ncbi:MAG: hypothetical protein CL878_09560 [Dehalococcoidia bacterium]|nr:hypothetical protein [Dehalococcoidia bacterium]